MHLPPDANIKYRQEAYSLSGGWHTATFAAGDTTWQQEFATVTIVFDLPAAMAAQL